jgi:hypothetical protein
MPIRPDPNTLKPGPPESQPAGTRPTAMPIPQMPTRPDPNTPEPRPSRPDANLPDPGSPGMPTTAGCQPCRASHAEMPARPGQPRRDGNHAGMAGRPMVDARGHHEAPAGITEHSWESPVLAAPAARTCAYAASAAAGAGRSSQSAHRGSGVRCPSTRQATPRGAAGAACKRQPNSAGVLSPLLWLHLAQAATTFSQACSPPRLRGNTWSMVSAEPRQ